LRRVGGGGKRRCGAEVNMEGLKTSQLHANVHAVVAVSLVDSYSTMIAKRSTASSSGSIQLEQLTQGMYQTHRASPLETGTYLFPLSLAMACGDWEWCPGRPAADKGVKAQVS
jgi:hypothetical protein